MGNGSKRRLDANQWQVLSFVHALCIICTSTHSSVLPSTNAHYPNESSFARILRFAPNNHPTTTHSSTMALGYVGNAAVTKECKDQSHGSHDQSLKGHGDPEVPNVKCSTTPVIDRSRTMNFFLTMCQIQTRAMTCAVL